MIDFSSGLEANLHQVFKGMEMEKWVTQYQKEKAIQVHSAMCTEACDSIIKDYCDVQGTAQEAEFLEALFLDVENRIFTDELKQFFRDVFGRDCQVRWPIFDVIDDQAIENYYSTTWHRDGGLKHMAKVFIYLNPVSEHHCNTLYYDEERTLALRETGALPLNLEERHLDVSEYLVQRGLDPKPSEFDLGAGDLLIFDPINLAHQCRPPKPGLRRYTLCYTVFPG